VSLSPPRSSFLALLAVLAAVHCGRAPRLPAAGSYSDVIVFAGAGAPETAAATLRGGLEAPVLYVGEPEPQFRLTVLPESRLGRERFHKNLVLVACLDGDGAAARLVRRLLRDADETQVRRAGAGRFAFVDPFARHQLVVVLTATTEDELAALLRQAAAGLAGELEASAVRRYRDELLEDPAAAARAARLRGTYGFEIRAPASYALSDSLSAWPQSILLARPGPTRLLTVFWLDGVGAEQARSADFVLGLQRDALWRLHGDTLLEDDLRLGPEPFGPHAGLAVHGTWQNRDDVAGGPLETHFVHDTVRLRLYGVQLQVFAPGRSKHPLVRELRALAGTFRVGAAAAAPRGAA
jgi:hypothetical protein